MLVSFAWGEPYPPQTRMLVSFRRAECPVRGPGPASVLVVIRLQTQGVTEASMTQTSSSSGVSAPPPIIRADHKMGQVSMVSALCFVPQGKSFLWLFLIVWIFCIVL